MPHKSLYYFAYGSNLHPLRLSKRIPSAKLIGAVALPGYQLAFHKKGSQCGSGKCDLVETGKSNPVAWGALYRVNASEKPILDGFEGLGFGYKDKSISVDYAGEPHHCFTYQAQNDYIDGSLKPFHWYKELVSVGAGYLGFPAQYRAFIDGHESVHDLDRRRHERHQELLGEMKCWGS